MKKIKLLTILLTALFLAGLTIRVIYVYQIREIPLTERVLTSPGFDQSLFNKNATEIAEGDWLLRQAEDSDRATPFYSYFLGIIYKLFNFSPLAARIIQAFLGASLCILLYFIGKETFNKNVGLICSFIASFYGVFIFYSGVLLRATLITFLNTLLILLLIRLSKKPKVKSSLFAGIVYGLSFLTRQNILLPFILIWLWTVLKKTPFRKFLKINTAFIIGIFLVFTPFFIRNCFTHSKLRLATVNPSGFWVGNTHDSPGVDLVYTDTYYKMVEKSKGSLKKTALLFLEEIKKRPKDYLNLYIRKVTMFLNGYEVPANLNYYLFREFPTVLRLPWFSFTLICPLALIGMALALFSKKKVSILYIFMFALSATVILSHVQARYRMPAIPLFIIFASYALYQLKAKRYRRLTLTVFVLISLFLFVKPDPSCRGYFRGRGFVRINDYINMANSYVYTLVHFRVERREPPPERILNDAITYLKKITELLPPWEETAASYHYHLGLAYSEKGQQEKAREQLEIISKLNPDFKPAEINLALLDYKPGDISEKAMAAFEHFLKENPDNLGALQNLASIYLKRGRAKDAITLYKKAVYYHPEAIEIYALLHKANKLKRLSKEEIAAKLKSEPLANLQTEQAEELSDSFRLAMKYISEKKYAEAIAQLQKALEESPDSVEALINLGVAYRANEEPEEAIATYERVLKIAPEAIPARYNLAMTLLKQEKFEEAIPHLEKIVNILPEFFLAQFHLAKAYEKTGLIDKAIQTYQNFISWAKDKPDKQRFVEQAEDKIAILQWQLKKAAEAKPDELLMKEGYE